MSFYRVQASTFPVADILEAENQLSISWNTGEDVRHGISACESREELATYLAQVGIHFTDSWVLVEFDGDYADEEDEDAHLGAVLTIPERIISTEIVGDAFGMEIMDAYEALLQAA